MRLCRFIPRFSLRTLVIFLLLVTSGAGLWWHWRPWYPVKVLRGPEDIPWELSAQAKVVLQSGTGGPWSVQFPDQRRTLSLCAGWPYATARIIDAGTRETLAALGAGAAVYVGHVAPDSRHIALVQQDPAHLGQNTIYIYRRRRPEWWWGVFWLWEFWLTAALAAVFVWSVARDRTALRATVPSPRPESGSARPGEEGLATPRLRATGDDVGEGQDGG